MSNTRTLHRLYSCSRCGQPGVTFDADGIEDTCDCRALNARVKADQQPVEERPEKCTCWIGRVRRPVGDPAGWALDRPACAVHSDAALAPAPAEERETPVEHSDERMKHLASAMRKVLPPALLREVVEHLDPLAPFMEFLREALPAEDRAVTAPQEPEQEKLHEASVSATNVEGPAQQGRHADSTNNRMASESTSEGEARATDAGNRDRQSWQEVERRLAALTHAIEALRGEMKEQSKQAIAAAQHAYNCCDYRNEKTLRGEAHIYSHIADRLAAILKEWEGRHA
jgi:hypothetical protein